MVDWILTSSLNKAFYSILLSYNSITLGNFECMFKTILFLLSNTLNPDHSWLIEVAERYLPTYAIRKFYFTWSSRWKPNIKEEIFGKTYWHKGNLGLHGELGTLNRSVYISSKPCFCSYPKKTGLFLISNFFTMNCNWWCFSFLLQWSLSNCLQFSTWVKKFERKRPAKIK